MKLIGYVKKKGKKTELYRAGDLYVVRKPGRINHSIWLEKPDAKRWLESNLTPELYIISIADYRDLIGPWDPHEWRPIDIGNKTLYKRRIATHEPIVWGV